MSEVHSIELLSDDAFGWYFSGLVDGEGSFGLYRRGGGRQDWRAVFSIKMRDDEEEHIRAIVRRMKCGGVCCRPKAGRDNPQVNWEVTKISDLVNIIVPHFDRFPLQLKKARDFLIWREGAVLLHQISQRSKTYLRSQKGYAGTERKRSAEEEARLAGLVDRLKATRAYSKAATI